MTHDGYWLVCRCSLLYSRSCATDSIFSTRQHRFAEPCECTLQFVPCLASHVDDVPIPLQHPVDQLAPAAGCANPTHIALLKVLFLSDLFIEEHLDFMFQRET